MGKFLLVCRLVGRDLRFRPTQAVLLLLAICAATTVLTLALALHGVTARPYQQTKRATRGPDLVVELGGFQAPHAPGQTGLGPQLLAEMRAVLHAPGVTGHSGPYPDAGAVLRARGHTAVVEVEGRDQAPAAVDQPKVTAGSWVRPDGVVLERTFAQALGVTVGDRVTLDGRAFTVAGIAVTAASPPFPNMCRVGCDFPLASNIQLSGPDLGLAWVARPDAASLVASAGPPAYLLNLRLADPAAAPAIAEHLGVPDVITWQQIAAADGLLVQDEQQVLLPGSWLAGLLAVASVAVLAGGRMAEHARRVGLLKAVGSTPGLVTAVLLAENMVLALLAAGAGLVLGWLAAPLLTNPGAALVGTPGAPSLTSATAGEVVGVAVVLALAATLVPAIRGARASTVSALASAVRPPRRRSRLIALSRRLPVPLLLGVRLVARRPRRALLGAGSIAVTMTGVVTVLTFHATADERLRGSSSGLIDPVIVRDEQMILVLTVVLLALSVLNAVITGWATALDAVGSSALARALGATRRQLSAGIAAAQLLPAVPGVLIGVPLGIGLFVAASGAGTTGTIVPPAGWLVAAVLATMAAVTGLAAIPAWAGARRPVTDVLAQES